MNCYDLLVMCNYIKINPISFGIFIVAGLALFLNYIFIRNKIMIFLKIKDVHGDFIEKDQKTILRLFAHIINDGLSDIEIKDIKIEIKKRNMFCILQGDIIKREDNDNIVISPQALNHSHIALMLPPSKKNLKINGSFLSTEEMFKEDTTIDAVLTVMIEPNKPQRLFTINPFCTFVKKKYKFKFQPTENFRIIPGEVIIPMTKQIKNKIT